MKLLTLTGVAAVMLTAGIARATLYTETFNPGTVIPDGNPVGVYVTGTVSDLAAGQTVNGLTVSLNLTGGYNGDLYAYLVAPDGTMVTLMNRPGVAINGFGASGPGMNITLQDGASDHGNIQNETSSSVLSGSYNAAGSLSGFIGSEADGNWTLFFADESNGGGTSTLNSWSLIVTVPEPANLALAVFAFAAVSTALIRRFR